MGDNRDAENTGQYTLLNRANDDMEDFKRSGFPDTIHREYEPPLTRAVEHVTLQRHVDQENSDWKLHRPSFSMSICKSMTSSFSSTVFGGVFVGIVATVIIWLIINLAGSCLGFKDLDAKWYDAPIYIQRIYLTLQIVEGSIIQLWSFVNFLAVFRWPLVKELNLHNWNMLVSFVTSLYLLLMNAYKIYNVFWINYPMHVLFFYRNAFQWIQTSKFLSSESKRTSVSHNQTWRAVLYGFPCSHVFLLLYHSFLLETLQNQASHNCVFHSILGLNS